MAALVFDSELLRRNSQELLENQINTYMDAAAGVILIRTREVVRAARIVREMFTLGTHKYREWDCAHGMREFTDKTLGSVKMGDEKKMANVLMDSFFKEVVEDRVTTIANDRFSVMVMMNPQDWYGNPTFRQSLQHLIHKLPETPARLIIISPDAVPADLAQSIPCVTLHPPGIEELGGIATRIIGSTSTAAGTPVIFPADEIPRLAYAGAGMSVDSFELALSTALVQSTLDAEEGPDPTELANAIMEAKTDIVRQTDLLELHRPVTLTDVGGLENLKDWLQKRKLCYTHEAQEWGVETPKGLLLVGVAGTGKTLTAKAVAGVFGIPMVRLDFGRLYNSLVGKTEERLRNALAMVESMAPVVLFIDEVEKALGGSTSANDGGVSLRVLGTFLTWLQENKHPVFTVVTANDISRLPPELSRRGRLDAIFATGMPHAAERVEVLRIHMAKRDYDISTYTAAEIQQFEAASDNYVPAEIEQAVKDALIDSFHEHQENSKIKGPSMAHILTALKNIRPIAETYKEQITALVEWAAQHATPASKPPEADSPTPRGRVTQLNRSPRTRPDPTVKH